MKITNSIVSVGVVLFLTCGAAIAVECPFIDNMGVRNLITEGTVRDIEGNIWKRQRVFVVDNKTKAYKAEYPKALYSKIVLAGGNPLDENADASGICIYRGDISRLQDQPDPMYFGDEIRVVAKKERR